MQVSRFSNGGFVIHKAIDGSVSAWFDSEGKLLDCERRGSRGAMRKCGGQIVARLVAIGKAWRN